MTRLSAAPCRLCGAQPRELPWRLEGGFRLVDCPSCGLVSTRPELSGHELAAYYPQTYYGVANRRFNPLFERLIRWFRARRARAVERFAPRAGRLLDVGCGRGLLPAQLRRRGWEAAGLELSEGAAQHARACGVPVHVGDFLTAPLPREGFDVLVLWHVLEHLPDPRGAVRRCRELLAPGGLLALAVPNYDSLQARAAGPHWFHLDVPRHYHHFRLRVLAELLASEGFAVASTAHFSLEQNPYGWIQSLLNRLGFHPNLLYEWLKDPTARAAGSPLRGHPVQCALIALALPVVAPAGFALFLLETVLRRGGTVEIYAYRGPAGRAPLPPASAEG